MKKSIAILFVVLLGGCAIPPKKSVGKIPSDEDPVLLSERLYGLARKCWAKEWGWFGDGVIVSSRIDFRGRVVEAKRYAPDIGVRKEFLEIVVTENEGRSFIEIWEGGELNPLSDKSMVPEIKEWIAGSNQCLTKK